ncbi:GNAT family N-acetyltransferase [Duganella sp. 1411]|uniref:bifunctional acetate--CoA ligase family protein/GNAT family N-acetyltransferase n=1 Tax=Duganella sp. 1411 TaxID=2806572 RepID=UPI0035A60C65
MVVFAGDVDQPDTQTSYGRHIAAQLEQGGFTGPVTFLKTGMTGTLGDLAQSRADLAVIALPDQDLAFALEVAGRIQCRAALILSSGVQAPLAGELHAIARRHGIHLLGPNCLGYQRPRLHINASVAGPLASPGSLALVSQSGALTSAILDWGSQNAVGFSTVVSLGPNTAVDLAQTLDFLATDPATQSIVLQNLVRGLSEKSRYYRFASSLRELSVPMLARYTLIDYDREMALVAVRTLRAPGPDGEFVSTSSIIGVSRYVANPDRSSCEFSLLVDDRFSGQGLGTRLMLGIMDVARDKGLSEIVGLVLCKNSVMLKLMASLGFDIRPYADDPDFRLCSKPL